jgi:hypothetical protein
MAPFPQSVTSIWMETDQVGDAGGTEGNLKKNRPSQDPHILNSDKWTEWQGQLYIGIQEKISAWRTLRTTDLLNSTDSALRMCPAYTHSPYSLCLHFPLFPFVLFLYAYCKGNLTDLGRILHLSLAKGNPK